MKTVLPPNSAPLKETCRRRRTGALSARATKGPRRHGRELELFRAGAAVRIPDRLRAFEQPAADTVEHRQRCWRHLRSDTKAKPLAAAVRSVLMTM
ncbi:hypothetical protein PV416_17075 [Streptomyces ipomoeae]|jgi:hypothetical protein|uniref:hypothetical protein n=1 Tax=Streptomyces ipomoeae TaxID=103232 RepID=UPI001C685C71|nr:hypothetical protein [Streptomyces ipomoeae]MDX2822771.1 hypothetical protein [Streptomyces ipomoeae]MDX2875438.1 hypothetical protein [Streptomyces ipomoeae]